MGFRKGVSGKTLDLSPNFLCRLIGTPQRAAILKKTVNDALKLALRTEFSTHGPAQHIGISQIEPGKMVTHFKYILLKNHHTVSLFQLLLHYGMEVGETLRMVKPVDVLTHHPTLGNPGTDNRTGCHQ